MKKRFFFRLPLLPIVFLLSLFSASANNLFAQQHENQVKIFVRILETGYNGIGDKGKNNLVWKFYRGNSHSEQFVLTNGKSETCFRVRSRKNSKTKEISDEKDELRPFLADISGFEITMEAFLNKKGGDKCIADAKDINYGIRTENIKPDNLLPGVWSDEIKIIDAFGTFSAIVVYKYELTEGLGSIGFQGSSSLHDVSKSLSLDLPIKLSKKETLPFTWSYSTGDQENWKTIPNTADDKSKIEFIPSQTIFANKITSSRKVNFRAEVETGGRTETTKTLELTLVPSAPDFDKEKDMQVIPVCNSLANGGIEIKNIKATSADIKYVLHKKTVAAETCTLKGASAVTCPGYITDSTLPSKKTLRIKGLAPAEYLLYIFNADLESGEVHTKTSFTIPELPPLKFKDIEPAYKHPTCENPTGGEIYMDVEDAENLWQVAVIPDKGAFKGSYSRRGNSITIKNLEAGKYTVYLSDRCGPELKKTITLKKPKQISIDKDAITGLPDKTDFKIQLNVLNGSNEYKVKTADQDNNVTESVFSFEPDIKIPINKPGTYTIEITDEAIPACPPARVKVKVDKSGNPKIRFKLKVLDE